MFGSFAVYKIQSGIGQNPSVNSLRRKVPINILKINVNRDRFIEKSKISSRDIEDIIEQSEFNENQSERQIQDLLDYSETPEEQKIRQETLRLTGKVLKYKLNTSKDFRDYCVNMQRQEAKKQIGLYLNIKDLNRFFIQKYEKQEDKKKASYSKRLHCPYCTEAFYGESLKQELHFASCRGNSNTVVGRVLMPNMTQRLRDKVGKSFDAYHATQPAAITLYCDFETVALKSGSFCSYCHRLPYGHARQVTPYIFITVKNMSKIMYFYVF